jgi:L-seryl-tRNA(Ser) seleniumtransferase
MMTLRDLPSVEAVVLKLESRYPRNLLVSETRRIVGELREQIRGGEAPAAAVEELVSASLDRLAAPSLRPVINATGVVLHTNLGRAPLPQFSPIPGYSNLEYDLDRGGRGKRDVHVSELIERLTGKPGIVVNNNAAAIFLTLNELAAGHEVTVSRGELIEIGDGFRIPEIMERSGALLREVGATNRTRLDDYRAGINERTRLLLRVHPSNFHISGFTGRPPLKDLAALAHECGLRLYEDLGSGCIADLRAFGISEPLVADSFEAGADVVTFSGDKLLGGPQAGIIAGDPLLIDRIRRNPLFRALRVDKLIYQALETTLRHLLFERYDCVPALRMLRASAESIRERADQLCGRLNGRGEVIPGESVAGGGSTPDQALPTWLIAMEGNAVELERKLRAGDPPVIARIQDDRLVIDLRAVAVAEEEQLVAALNYARST